MSLAVFIPVRLDSSRLPGKALLDLAGKPSIQHLVERLALAQAPQTIVICTSVEPSDDPLVEVAKTIGVRLFRGSKEDLLRRFYDAALHYEIDRIINVDGDDLLVDPEQVDAVAALLKSSGADFVKCEGLPFGAAPVGLRVGALARVCEMKDQSDTATGWGRFFSDSRGYRTATLVISDPELRHPEIRMTLDYEEDYRFFCAVFEELAETGQPVRLREAIRLIVRRPDIQALNAGLGEKYWAHFNQGLT
jgi:spore coat polysaccharide biosynthesis protein SpsF